MKVDKAHMCDAHKRRLEAFCEICDARDGRETAMCAICMCEHHNKVHGGKTRHITTTIKDILGEVDVLLQKGEDHQLVLQKYNTEAEKLLKAKDDIRWKVDGKLKELRDFYKKQKAEVASNNALILLCHESIMKATQKSEYKIKENMKDPNKVKRRVNDMMDREDYWVALDEARRALAEDARFDETLIKDEFDKGRALLEKYEKQLSGLDVIHLDPSEHTKLVNERAELTRNIKAAQGIFFDLLMLIDELTVRKAAGDENQRKIDELIKQLSISYYANILRSKRRRN